MLPPGDTSMVPLYQKMWSLPGHFRLKAIVLYCLVPPQLAGCGGAISSLTLTMDLKSLPFPFFVVGLTGEL